MDCKLLNDKDLPEHIKNKQFVEPKLDVAAIPDLDVLLGDILEMLEYMDKPEMIDLEKTNEATYEQHLDTKFDKISSRYYKIFKLLLDRNNRELNLKKLIDMLMVLKEIKSGKVDIKKADDDFHENMNEKFVYPKFGGKDKYLQKVEELKKEKKKKK